MTIDTKSFFLLSKTDERAVVCDANSEVYVVDSIEGQFGIHRSQMLKTVNTLRDNIVAEMKQAARLAGFEIDTESMLVW